MLLEARALFIWKKYLLGIAVGQSNKLWNSTINAVQKIDHRKSENKTPLEVNGWPLFPEGPQVLIPQRIWAH